MKKNWKLKNKLRSGLLKSKAKMMKKKMILRTKNHQRVKIVLLILKRKKVHRTN